MKRFARRAGILAATALLAAWPAAGTAAQQDVDERRPARSDVRIEIEEIVVGRIDVTAWDRDEVHITGRLGRDVHALEIEGDERAYEIRAELDDHDWWDDEAEDGRRRDRDRHRDHDADVTLEIRAPNGASLSIEGVTASITVRGIAGRVEVETVTGTIVYAGGARELELATVTGNIDVEAERAERGSFETVQGNITYTGALAASGRYGFETVGGSVTLYLPEDVSASFDIETMMGGIDTDFGVQPRRTQRWVPSQELRFEVGGGAAKVNIETLQGRVQLRKR